MRFLTLATLAALSMCISCTSEAAPDSTAKVDANQDATKTDAAKVDPTKAEATKPAAATTANWVVYTMDG